MQIVFQKLFIISGGNVTNRRTSSHVVYVGKFYKLEATTSRKDTVIVIIFDFSDFRGKITLN